MAKRLILVFVLAFVVGIALNAYAEVQNVKVSGDLEILGVARDNLDLAKERPTNSTNALITKSDKVKDFLSITRVRVDADLTDNVSTTVRLINERDWDSEDNTNTDIDLGLALVTLKEFLYSPLTLTLGRQELHFGNDFIVGDPDTNGIVSAAAGGFGINQGDLSSRKGFDAVKANLNYDPLVLDMVIAKINEGTNTLNDDTTLYGVNANYALNKETTLEGYGFAKTTGSNTTAVNSTAFTVNPTKADKVFTIGARAKNTSVKNLTAQLEGAFQFGTYNPQQDINATNTASKTMQRRAWGLEAIAAYDLKDVEKIAKYAPSITGAYIYLSGDNALEKSNDKVWRGWDSMYENQTFGHLINAIMGFTNSHTFGLSGKMKPAEDVTLKVDYVYLLLDKAYRGGANNTVNLKGVSTAPTYLMTHNRFLGQEIDAKVTYDYTEDVQLGLLAGVFLPGSAFEKETTNGTTTTGNRTAAAELIGSMKVTF